jgi:hypothetical protein
MSGIDLELRYQCCQTTALPGFPQMAHLTIICGPSFHNTVDRCSGSRTRPSSWGGLCSSSSTDYNMHILACLPCYVFVHWAYNANLIRPILCRIHSRLHAGTCAFQSTHNQRQAVDNRIRKHPASTSHSLRASLLPWWIFWWTGFVDMVFRADVFRGHSNRSPVSTRSKFHAVEPPDASTFFAVGVERFDVGRTAHQMHPPTVS